MLPACANGKAVSVGSRARYSPRHQRLIRIVHALLSFYGVAGGRGKGSQQKNVPYSLGPCIGNRSTGDSLEPQNSVPTTAASNLPVMSSHLNFLSKNVVY